MHLWLGTQDDNMKDAAAKGRLACSDLRKLRISIARKGQRHLPEVVEHIAAQNRGKRRPLDAVRRAAEKNRGQKRTPEQINNMRQARWSKHAA